MSSRSTSESRLRPDQGRRGDGRRTRGGRRAILNYGHTLAHAIETAGAYDLRHGEAVAIGIRYAAEIARRLGRIDDDRVAEHERVLAAYELPTTVPEQLTDTELMDFSPATRRRSTV